MAKEKKAKKAKGFFQEFREFINRGNAFMLAIGVVIGGAFSAIVNAFVNILLSLATWPVPGGLKGFVTVLPALSDGQKGPVGQDFTMDQLVDKTIEFAQSQGVEITKDSDTFVQWQTALLGKYTQHGTTYTFNGAAVIDWGALATAVISFIIIAVVLFIIVKVANSLQAKKEAAEARAREEYFKKHPEERPAPVEPGVPAPTTEELLTQIRDLLAEKKK